MQNDRHRTLPLGRAVWTAVWFVVICGSTAAAQNTDPRTTARLRLGPVAVAPTVALRDLGVDTNVYNESLRDPVRDFAFTVVPAFTAILGPRRANLTLRSATDLVYFARQRSERSVNEDLTASGRVSLGRVSPFMEAAYLNTRHRLSDEIDARARYVQKRGAAGTGLALTPKIGVEVRGELWRMAFDADATFDEHDLARELNRETTSVSGTVRYTATPLTSVLFSSEASSARFPGDSIRDTDARQFQLGLDLSPRALIAGSVRVGYQQFRPRSGELPGFNGFIGSADVSYRLQGATTLGFAFGRSTDFSYMRDEPYYVRESYGLSLNRRIASRWDVEIDASRIRYQYRRRSWSAGEAGVGHSDRMVSGTIILGHDLAQSTRVTTSLSYQTRVSDFSDRTFDGVRVGTSIAYGF